MWIELQQDQEQLIPSSPQEARSSTEVIVCDIFLSLILNIYSFAVSINIRNGVTGSLGDPATLKLVDQEDEQDEDLLPQASTQDGHPDDEPLLA